MKNNAIRKLDPPQIDVHAYYLLACIERSQTNSPLPSTIWSETEFNDALLGFINSRDKDQGSWKYEELKTNHDLLKHKLLVTLSGQRWLRFPRVSITSDGTIVLRYPFPEIYFQAADTRKFQKGVGEYDQYLHSLKDAAARPGEEIVLIELPRKRNTVDFERVDWQRGVEDYRKMINPKNKS